MQYYPAFRRAILHFGVDSLPLLTRPPLPRAKREKFKVENLKCKVQEFYYK